MWFISDMDYEYSKGSGITGNRQQTAGNRQEVIDIDLDIDIDIDIDSDKRVIQ